MAANSPTERIYRRTTPRTTDEVWGMTNPERPVAGSRLTIRDVASAAPGLDVYRSAEDDTFEIKVLRVLTIDPRTSKAAMVRKVRRFLRETGASGGGK